MINFTPLQERNLTRRSLKSTLVPHAALNSSSQQIQLQNRKIPNRRKSQRYQKISSTNLEPALLELLVLLGLLLVALARQLVLAVLALGQQPEARRVDLPGRGHVEARLVVRHADVVLADEAATRRRLGRGHGAEHLLGHVFEVERVLERRGQVMLLLLGQRVAEFLADVGGGGLVGLELRAGARGLLRVAGFRAVGAFARYCECLRKSSIFQFFLKLRKIEYPMY